MSVLADQSARDRIRSELDTTFVVEAAAGTGKTTELVARLMAVVRAGRGRLQQIVAVTFTEKAAGEMKLRLRAALEQGREDPTCTFDERGRLEQALAELELARIGTIHALCADLLRERPVEAGIDPLFEVAAGDEAARLLDAAFDAWFQRVLRDPPEGVRRLLRRRPKGKDSPGPRQLLRQAATALVEHRDFDASWRRAPFEREPRLDALVEQLAELGAYAAKSQRQSYLVKHLTDVQRFVDELRHREKVAPRDHDGLEATLRDLSRWRSWQWSGSGELFAPNIPRADVLRLRDRVRAELDALVESSDADVAALLHQEVQPVLAAYEELKARAGKLDFFDLLLRTRDLIRGERAVREGLQGRFTHLFVDEFQDTDPLQAEILLLLSADDSAMDDPFAARPVPGKLFLVGDPKQSIYRFRRADVRLYEVVKESLLGRGAQLVHLSTSFRSAPSIQEAVNAAFAPKMNGGDGGTQARYVPLSPFRAEICGQPTVVALPVPRPYGERNVSKQRIEVSNPDAIAAFVDWLITRSGWRVSEPESGGSLVPVAARHVCILFKRFMAFGQDVPRPYAQALEARQIPHVLVGGRSFHEREEVLALRNALAAIEWPEDELAVFATLRGPLFALNDDALLAFRDAQGRLHPMRRFELEASSPPVREVGEALGILGKLHLGRNHRPIADTLTRLLDATRAHAGLANWHGGEQVLANVLRVVELARRFEARGADSFRAFVERLEDEAARGEVAEAPVAEEGTEGVRMMTVHRAKGLEFPVVVLAEPGAPAVSGHPSRHVDPERRLWVEPLAWCAPVELLEHREDALRRDTEEAVRLAYVAATRARDLLVVPVVGDEKLDGWVDVLHPVLYPAQGRWRSSSPAAGCPQFGEDSVLDRGGNAERHTHDSVAPGEHAPEAGEHRVVWWDPAVLELDKPHGAGLRMQRILEADEGGAVSEASAQAHRAWRARRDGAIERGARPSAAIRTMRDRASEQVEAGRVPVERTDAARDGRPSGKRFGALVHAVLAEVPLHPAADFEPLLSRAGRLVAATVEELGAAREAVRSALRHPLLERAALAEARGECRREAPLLHRAADGELIEGVIDLAFRESGVWTVVELKTDAVIHAQRAAYEAQALGYAEAISAATGEPATATLLQV